MTVLLVDPALHSLGGHHYSAVERLQQVLAGLGIAAPCLGSAQADAATQAALACRPVFTRSVYGRLEDDERTVAEDIERTTRELAAAMRGRAGPDLVILPCADPVTAVALARCLRRGPSRGRPRVLLWLLYGPHPLKAPDDPHLSRHRLQARRAYAALAAVAEVRAWCETAPMAAFWQPLVSFPVAVHPAPGPAVPPRPSRPAGKPPLVSCIGFANRAKGYRLLPDALPTVLERHASVRFLIHGIVTGSDAAEDGPLFDRLAALGERVSVRREVLDTPTYLDILAATDLLLLPYDPNVYGVRGSGIVAEARRSGTPVIAPRPCAFAQPAFAEGWGVAMESYDSPGVAKAILEALGHRDGLARQAAAVATRSRDDLDHLLQEALKGLPLPPLGLGNRLRQFWQQIA